LPGKRIGKLSSFPKIILMWKMFLLQAVSQNKTIVDGKSNTFLIENPKKRT
jgi:hypothetical protein